MSPVRTGHREAFSHTLHLYTSEVDKDVIHRAFLASMARGGRAMIVSSEGTMTGGYGIPNVRIIELGPDGIEKMEEELPDGRSRLIIDAGSFPREDVVEIEARERYLDRLVRNRSLHCLCTYEVGEISPKALRILTKFHSKLHLTTGDISIISGSFLKEPAASYESIKKTVRDDLEAIVLALIQREAMCGTDIIGAVNLEFNILLSPGAVYPLLDSLQRRGLLTSSRDGKERIYSPAEDSEHKIRKLVNEHIQAQKLLNRYLQQNIG